MSTTPVVIDYGSCTCKAGFAGKTCPSVVFPAVVGKPRNQAVMPDTGRKHSYVGNEAQAKRGILTLTFPIESGTVVNWEDVENLWNYIFYKELRVAPQKQPVLLTEMVTNSVPNREKMAEIMFEALNVPALSIAQQSILSLHDAGLKTGFVLDSGYLSSHCVPIHENQIVKEAIETTLMAGNELTEYFVKILEEKGYKFSGKLEKELVNDMKEDSCYVVLDFEAEIGKPDPSHKKTYEMPDGSSVTAGKEFFRCPEALFQADVLGRDFKGIHEIVHACVMKCNETVRNDMYSNILLAGGNTLFPGIAKRLHKELKILAPSSTTVKVRAPKDRELSAWRGGSKLASDSSSPDIWVTKTEFEEIGASILRKKCP